MEDDDYDKIIECIDRIDEWWFYPDSANKANADDLLSLSRLLRSIVIPKSYGNIRPKINSDKEGWLELSEGDRRITEEMSKWP